MSAVDRLRVAIQAGQAVVVAGTGVSAASSGNAPTATWVGLIRDGVQFAISRGGEGTAGRWQKLVEGQLELALEEQDTDQLLQAASQVSARIRRIGAQAHANWLQDAVGSLALVDSSWAQAIVALASPVFTTNYDSLIERATGRASTDWTQPKDFQQILSRGVTHIGHLHGSFDRPESVVLSDADYQRLRDSEASQALQRAISSTRSMLYVGCGSTLEDPNLGRLMEWHRELFADSGVEHFRLCRADESSDLERYHADDNITVVEYGSSYSNLPAFLAALQPDSNVAKSDAGIVRDAVADAREFLLDQLRREAIIGDGLSDVDERELDEVAIPPVLIPVPHAEFFRARGTDESRPKRLDPQTLVAADKIILLVADENSGLSTALKWLLHEGSRTRSRVAPLLLDFRRFPQGVGPLVGQSKLEAYHRGLIDGRRSDLPPMVVGVDDFHGHSKTSVRTAEDLSNISGLTILAVHSAYEGETLEVLRAVGVEPVLAYVGRLAASDVKAMVRLVSPGQVDSLSEVVLATIRTEHLPRTPFTVALLVSILMRGEALVANASPTTILEQYVSHLLGRDGADEDPRFALTSTDREALLTDLARLFVEMDQGSMLQSDVVEQMEAFFARLGWSESPAQVLADLARRRVLTLEGVQVRFTQSSFLHLFAAKAATRRPETLDSMLLRPLYYSPVIRAYAGLVRHDDEVLRRLEYLLDDALEIEVAGTALAKQELADAPDDLERRFDLTAQTFDGDADAERESGALEFELPEPLEDDKDVLPFPLTTDADLGPLARAVGSVDLVSGVLRDSEEVEDLDLKRSVLLKTLRTWGMLTDVFLADDAFQEVQRAMRDAARDYFGDENQSATDIEQFISVLPGVIVYTGISLSLASRKLILILEQVLDGVDLENDPAVAVPAAIMINAIHEPLWHVKYGELMQHHETTWMGREVLLPMLLIAYDVAPSNSEEERKVRELAVRAYIKNFKFKNRQHQNATADSFARHLTRLKASGQLSDTPSPQGVIEA